MNVDLFLKNVPQVVKELISREAVENRRSINQEAIALLEEALVMRVGAHQGRPRTALEQLRGYVDGKTATGESLGARDGADVRKPGAH